MTDHVGDDEFLGLVATPRCRPGRPTGASCGSPRTGPSGTPSTTYWMRPTGPTPTYATWRDHRWGGHTADRRGLVEPLAAAWVSRRPHGDAADVDGLDLATGSPDHRAVEERVAPWRARRIAAADPRAVVEAAAYVDAQVASVADSCGPAGSSGWSTRRRRGSTRWSRQRPRTSQGAWGFGWTTTRVCLGRHVAAGGHRRHPDRDPFTDLVNRRPRPARPGQTRRRPTPGPPEGRRAVTSPTARAPPNQPYLHLNCRPRPTRPARSARSSSSDR